MTEQLQSLALELKKHIHVYCGLFYEKLFIPDKAYIICMFLLNIVSTFFRWETYCQDTAVEKAGAYIGISERNKSDSENRELGFSLENCLQSSGLSSFTSSQFHETEPPLRCQRLVERYVTLA